ncbi:hypothetical protein ACLB2K_029967 [Fragaria x ananassa]
MFYAPVLFNTIGFGSDASLISAVITGTVNVIATAVSMYGVDKWGRRKLFLEGGTQMLICQIVVAVYIGAKFGLNGNAVPSEIFNLEIRSAAQSINVSVNMILTFVVAQVFLTMLCPLDIRALLLLLRLLRVCHVRFCALFLARDKGDPD